MKKNGDLRPEYKRETLGKGVKGKFLNVGKLKVIPDFLPPPDQLVFREEGVKVAATPRMKNGPVLKTKTVK
jgi:hypothetical protein